MGQMVGRTPPRKDLDMDPQEPFTTYGGRSAEEYEQLLMAKLQPQVMRSTLAFAGLYQITHEMLKQAIPEKVRDFYCTGFNEDGFTYDDVRYRRDVIDAARTEGWITKKEQKFDASAAWLVRMEAITKQHRAPAKSRFTRSVGA